MACPMPIPTMHPTENAIQYFTDSRMEGVESRLDRPPLPVPGRL